MMFLGALAILAGQQIPALAGDKEVTLTWKAFDAKAPPFYQTLTTATKQT